MSGAVLVVTVAVPLSLLMALPAHAAVAVSRAEVSGSDLRLEGTAIAGRDIVVDGVVMGRSDSDGEFRIERSGYVPPSDCTVDLADGTATVTSARLSGCTTTEQPPPPAGDTTAPTAPTGLTATLTGSTADLSWTAATDDVGVTGYRVSRNGSVLPGTVSGTTFADAGLAAGAYSYTVAAVDGAGNVSAESGSASVTVQPPPATDTTAPTVPADLTATLSGTMASLRWTASADDVGVTGYRVTRNGEVVTTVLNPFYDDTNRTVGTWTYTVAAVDGAGNVSAESNSASVTVQPPPETDTTAPTVPPNFTATVVGTTVSVGWGLSTDDTAVTGYRLTRDGTVLSTTLDMSYVDSGLAAGTYTYTVAAFDGAGNVSAANSVSATVQQAEALTFLTPSRLPDAVVGEAYLASIVCSDPPGPSTFKFKLVSGEVPDGTRFSGNTLENRPEARVTGTPSDAGTYSFTVQVKDNTGATARRTFTITVLPAS
ncbi:putative Ig domain-containing protein [Blastococcus sp. SYSU DS0510]